MSAHANQPNWSEYYRRAQNTPARETLLKALAAFDAEPPAEMPRSAIDLGAGAGQDTFELLRRGWHVLAIDQEPQSIARIRAGAAAIPGCLLTARQSAFEQLAELPQADLINASYSLPFCDPSAFPAFWTLLGVSLTTGGRLAGHLFGDHDTWESNSQMNFHTIAEVERLLSPYEVEFFQEHEEDGKDAFDIAKHWHVYSFVVRRK